MQSRGLSMAVNSEQSLKISYVLQIVLMCLIAVLGYTWQGVRCDLKDVSERLRNLELNVARVNTLLEIRNKTPYALPESANVTTLADNTPISPRPLKSPSEGF